jgi:hypothetical protein
MLLLMLQAAMRVCYCRVMTANSLLPPLLAPAVAVPILRCVHSAPAFALTAAAALAVMPMTMLVLPATPEVPEAAPCGTAAAEVSLLLVLLWQLSLLPWLMPALSLAPAAAVPILRCVHSAPAFALTAAAALAVMPMTMMVLPATPEVPEAAPCGTAAAEVSLLLVLVPQ